MNKRLYVMGILFLTCIYLSNLHVKADNVPIDKDITGTLEYQMKEDEYATDIPEEIEKLERIEEKQREIDDEEIGTIELQFEDTSLTQLVDFMSSLFDLTFITNDIIDPLPENAKNLSGHKVSFRTNNPLTKQEAWNLFLTFLDLAGFAIVPDENPKIKQIVQTDKAKNYPLPTYINIPLDKIPSNDQSIRYIYFVQNATLDALQPIIEKLKSPSSAIVALQEHKAFLLIDKSYNIKSLVEIIKELDKVSRPQAMSILKLHRANAEEVKKLYESIVHGEQAPPSRFFPTRKSPSTLYFPEDVRIISENRTNTLILLGPEEDILKIEEFILKYVDVDIKRPYSPLYVYDLQYAEAAAVAEILKEVTRFGEGSEAAKVGGVRSGDKYFKPMTFTAESETNRLIIKADYEDYLKVKEIIKQLDEPQPQVAIELLILTLTLENLKILGAQIRSKEPFGIDGLLGDNIKFQTSGLQTGANFTGQGIVTRNEGNGVFRLLGDLVQLAVGAPAANTLITLGDRLGVWGIFQLLEQVTSTDVIANPFLIATNKTRARVSIGQARRVVSSTVIGVQEQNAFATENANLTVDIIPQINSDGMIVLELIVSIDTFRGAETDPQNVAKDTRRISTKTIVSDKEVLALGGLVQDTIENKQSGIPLLSRIPILGWLVKNKFKREEHTSLLILLSTRIIDPTETTGINSFSEEHVGNYYEMSAHIRDESNLRDPIDRLFFTGTSNISTDAVIDDFILEREDRFKKRKKKRRHTKKNNEKAESSKAQA